MTTVRLASASARRFVLGMLGVAYRLVRPSLFAALIVNRATSKSAASRRPHGPATSSSPVDLGAATALWQAETARINGLTTKAAGILAAQALVGAGLAAMTNTTGLSRAAVVASTVYLAGGLAAAVRVQLPRPMMTVLRSDLRTGQPAEAMLEVTEANELAAIQLSNLVTSSVCDTARSLSLVLVAVVAGVV